jgi:hypothetical protein
MTLERCSKLQHHLLIPVRLEFKKMMLQPLACTINKSQTSTDDHHKGCLYYKHHKLV